MAIAAGERVSLERVREASRVPALAVLSKQASALDPFVKYGGVGPTTDLSKGYLVVMQHPVTTEYDEARHQVDETLYAVREVGLPILWFWPNVDGKIEITVYLSLIQNNRRRAVRDHGSRGIGIHRDRDAELNRDQVGELPHTPVEGCSWLIGFEPLCL